MASNDKVPSKVKVKTPDGATNELQSGALERFSIIAFKDEDVTDALGVFVASYNPTTFSVNHATSFDEGKQPASGTSTQKFKHRNPRTLSVELFFDGTGASNSAKSSGTDISGLLSEEVKEKVKNAQKRQEEDRKGSGKNIVDQQVSEFLTVCYDIDGINHKPPFLVLVWGTFYFSGILESANVSYSLFASDGSPIRAKISISVKEHVGKKKIDHILRFRSPDLTQFRTVFAGDTLYNLAKRFYGDPSLYLQLAAANNLTNYRKLKPGTQLIFPPIEKIKGRA